MIVYHFSQRLRLVYTFSDVIIGINVGAIIRHTFFKSFYIIFNGHIGRLGMVHGWHGGHTADIRLTYSWHTALRPFHGWHTLDIWPKTNFMIIIRRLPWAYHVQRIIKKEEIVFGRMSAVYQTSVSRVYQPYVSRITAACQPYVSRMTMSAV